MSRRERQMDRIENKPQLQRILPPRTFAGRFPILASASPSSFSAASSAASPSETGMETGWKRGEDRQIPSRQCFVTKPLGSLHDEPHVSNKPSTHLPLAWWRGRLQSLTSFSAGLLRPPKSHPCPSVSRSKVRWEERGSEHEGKPSHALCHPWESASH